MEPESGKSIVGLGLMELLSRRVERLGFFRPIVPEEPDPQLELMRSRYDAATAHALTSEEAGAAQPYDELRKAVVAAYKPLEAECDFVLCEGTDFTGAAPALDFGLNADLANELGAPGARRRPRRRAGADGGVRPRRARWARDEGLRRLRRGGQPRAGRVDGRRLRRGRLLRSSGLPHPGDGGALVSDDVRCRRRARCPRRPRRIAGARGSRRARRGDERRALRRAPRRRRARDRSRRPPRHPRRDARRGALAGDAGGGRCPAHRRTGDDGRDAPAARELALPGARGRRADPRGRGRRPLRSAAGSGRRTSGRSRPRSGSSTRASTPTSWPSASRSSGRRA